MNFIIDALALYIGWTIIGLFFLAIGYTIYGLHRGFRFLISKFKGN